MTDERTRPERRIWRSDVRQDVDDELAFHLAMRERDFIAEGATEAAARAAAAARFGDRASIAADCRRIDEEWAREQRRAGVWTDLRQDAVYAVRSLRKAPGFAAVAILALALGIGANTAIFSVIKGVLLRALPYRQPERVVFLWSSNPSSRPEPLTPARLLDFRERMTSTAGIAGISQIPLNLTGVGDPERLPASSVSSNFFDLLGVPPMLGDTFHAGSADGRAVVLSYGLWVRRFGADRQIIGKEIALNGSPRTVVAVMPREFEWPTITARPTNAPGPELWIPGTPREVPRTPVDRPDDDLAQNRVSGYIRAVARLKEGATLAQAQKEAEAVASAIGVEHPETDGERSAVLVPLRAQFFGHVREPLLVLLGAVALVLAIACANVASLLLGRATSRRKEIALRLALGASRTRIVRQLLTESVMLAAAGAACGLVIAWWAQSALIRLTPAGALRLEHVGIDPIVLGFAALLAVTTGVLFGLAPALHASRGAVHADLQDGGARASAGPRSGRMREVLVTLQMAVTLVLLVGAILLLRSFSALQRVDTGIDTRHVVAFDIFLSGPRAEYQARQLAFYDEILGRIRALPGVSAAGAAVTLPIGGDDFSTSYVVDGKPVPPGREPSAGYQVVTPGYFSAMGIRVLAGRDFDSRDVRSSQPVAIVNHAFAEREWPGVDPVGRRLRAGGDSAWMTVVGVVSDIRHLGPSTPPRAEFYQPNAQRSFPFMAFVVRTNGDPSGIMAPLRAAILAVDPLQPISGLSTMEEHLARALSRPRFMSTLVGAFGVLALVLSIVGIYGVMSYSVTERTREIAIRLALGAQSASVVRMILSRTALLTCAGIAGGVAGAAAATRVLAGLLFGIGRADAGTFAAAAAILGIAALIAGAVPAIRASHVNGTDALRS